MLDVDYQTAERAAREVSANRSGYLYIRQLGAAGGGKNTQSFQNSIVEEARDQAIAPYQHCQRRYELFRLDQVRFCMVSFS